MLLLFDGVESSLAQLLKTCCGLNARLHSTSGQHEASVHPMQLNIHFLDYSGHNLIFWKVLSLYCARPRASYGQESAFLILSL